MKEHRRPAGVDPSVLGPKPVEHDARIVAQRVAANIAAYALAGDGHRLRDVVNLLHADQSVAAGLGEAIHAITWSTSPRTPAGDLDLRLSYSDGVTIAALVVEALTSAQHATDRRIFADLRQKVFTALGLV